jgi:hypothetical protein
MRKGLYDWKRLAGVGGISVALLFSSPPAQAQSAIELRVKAAFVYNFAKFTQWPAGNAEESGPFVIGCFGDAAFMEVLTATVAGKLLNGRAITVKRVTTIGDLDACQVLFVGDDETSRAQVFLHAATTAHVLTVGASDHFATSGGMIQLVVVDNGVKFAINQQEAELAGLKISSKLLELAIKDHRGGG